MTIAEFLSVAESEDLADRLEGKVTEGTWICHGVEYAVPDRDFCFQRAGVVPLAQVDRS